MDYKQRLSISEESQIEDDIHTALCGKTNIDCFDYWISELKNTGYLHNHARMWFASIWIHHLKLPWYKGAQFFLEYLIDGDPAVNTLSWRWVAGLHTKGKFYKARPSNIQKFTENRFEVGKLSDGLIESEDINHPLVELSAISSKPNPGRDVLVISYEDLGVGVDDDLKDLDINKIYILHNSNRSVPLVRSFVDRAIVDCKKRVSSKWQCNTEIIQNLSDIKELDRSFSYELPIGYENDRISSDDNYSKVQWMRRSWDAKLWPHATEGFFKFFKKLLKQLFNFLPPKYQGSYKENIALSRLRMKRYLQTCSIEARQ